MLRQAHQTPYPTRLTEPLHALLDDSLRLPPEYHDQLTSHLPMALHALHSLGAPAQRMQDFFARYSRRFQGLHGAWEDMPTLARAVPWKTLRSQANPYPVLRASMAAQLQQQGISAALHQLLPELLQGVSAAAFHGVIRTAHAVESSHAGELAAALAYWAWRWQPLAPAATGLPLLDVEVWSQQLVAQSVGWHGDGQLISTRMEHASHSDVYRRLAGALVPAVDLRTRVGQLAAFAMRAYVRQPNFTMLHMVTGLRALRTLLPWLPDTPATQSVLANACVAAYLAAHVLPSDAPVPCPVRTWADVIAAAIASDDDHVIKLVHACREEYAAYGDEDYVWVASLVTRGKGAL